MECSSQNLHDRIKALCSQGTALIGLLMEDQSTFSLASSGEQNGKVTFFLRGTIRDIKKIVGNDAALFRCIKTLLEASVSQMGSYEVKLIADIVSGPSASQKTENEDA